VVQQDVKNECSKDMLLHEQKRNETIKTSGREVRKSVDNKIKNTEKVPEKTNSKMTYSNQAMKTNGEVVIPTSAQYSKKGTITTQATNSTLDNNLTKIKENKTKKSEKEKEDKRKVKTPIQSKINLSENTNGKVCQKQNNKVIENQKKEEIGSHILNNNNQSNKKSDEVAIANPKCEEKEVKTNNNTVVKDDSGLTAKDKVKENQKKEENGSHFLNNNNQSNKKSDEVAVANPKCEEKEVKTNINTVVKDDLGLTAKEDEHKEEFVEKIEYKQKEEEQQSKDQELGSEEDDDDDLEEEIRRMEENMRKREEERIKVEQEIILKKQLADEEDQRLEEMERKEREENACKAEISRKKAEEMTRAWVGDQNKLRENDSYEPNVKKGTGIQLNVIEQKTNTESVSDRSLLKHNEEELICEEIEEKKPTKVIERQRTDIKENMTTPIESRVVEPKSECNKTQSYQTDVPMKNIPKVDIKKEKLHGKDKKEDKIMKEKKKTILSKESNVQLISNNSFVPKKNKKNEVEIIKIGSPSQIRKAVHGETKSEDPLGKPTENYKITKVPTTIEVFQIKSLPKKETSTQQSKIE